MKPTPENPFVIVDTDTESAGSTFLYKAKTVFYKDSRLPSVQKRMLTRDDKNYKAASGAEKLAFFGTMHPIGDCFGLSGDQERAVLLIGVNLDRDSAAGTDTTGKNSEQLTNFTNNITRACRMCGAKALIFDTPSGTQFLARKSINDSDIVVCCMRPTMQFRESTRDQLIKFVKKDIEDDMKKTYILTPTTVCVDDGQEFGGQTYPTHALREIKCQFDGDNIEDESDEIKKAFKNNVSLEMLKSTPASKDGGRVYDTSEDSDRVFGIPEVKRFKWFERCLGCIDEEELETNDKVGINRYDVLARLILKTYEKNKE